MSIIGLVAFSVLIQGGSATQPAKPQAATLISEMFQKYYSSKEVVGSIVMTQTYDKHSYTIKTQLQFERKYKIYIKQVSSRTPQEVWLTSSTGQYFCYDVPAGLAELAKQGFVSGKRFAESQTFDNKVMEIGEVYHAASKSLGDRSVPLDIAIAHKEDLVFIRNQWKTLNLKGTKTFQGEEVYEITGAWRPYLTADARGTYSMLINTKKELKQYTTTELFSYGREAAKPITTTWDVDIKLDQKSDQDLYKIYK